MQEFRASVQLYCSIVKTMQAVFTDQAAPAEDDEINAIRQKLKIAR
jgi:hypothetical protein